MDFVKDIIVVQRRDNFKPSTFCVLICENFNQVDISGARQEKFEPLCVDIYVEYTANAAEAAATVEFLRQKVENIQLSQWELSKGRGAGGHFRYLYCLKVTDEKVARNAVPITFLTVVADLTGATAYHGCVNANEGRNKPFQGFCWKYNPNDQSICEFKDSFTEIDHSLPVKERDGEKLKIGHKMMKGLISFYSSFTQRLYHSALIPTMTTLVQKVVVSSLTTGDVISLLQQQLGAATMWALYIHPMLYAQLENVWTLLITRRLDERMYIAVEAGKLNVYVRNVFLKGIILWGDARHLDLFLANESKFYEDVQPSIDVLNDFMYDTTDEEETPLLDAIAVMNVDIVRGLLSHGARLDVAEKYFPHYSVAQCAERTRCEEIIDLVQRALQEKACVETR